MLIDTHTHFDYSLEVLEEKESALLASYTESDVSYAVQVSTNLESLKWSRSFAKRYKDKGIFFTAGIHPSTPQEAEEKIPFLRELDSILQSPERSLFIGIGECGLDYYRMRIPKEDQKNRFSWLLEAAHTHNLPVIVHCREAMNDTINMLKKYKIQKGIMHCFAGSIDDAQQILDLGLDISFAGNVTYKKATDLQETAKYVPINRLLLETDAPYLTPVPLRGKKNRVEYIKHTYQFIAELKNISVEELSTALNENFNAFIPEK